MAHKLLSSCPFFRRDPLPSQKPACETIKLVTFNQRLGPDKPGNAMKSALNEAAAAGANGFYVVSASTDWAEGASVVGEALRCKS